MEPSDRTAPRGGAVTTLDRIDLGCRCRVVGIRASGALRKRLFAMGMVPGADVEAIRVAPLGDPVEYRVKGYALSMRRAEAGLIEVVLEEE
ncbi:MAG: ferrous iron transport protein [Euryarchaeota archaeon]|nr:ferrous iron transport protein [Euryarchaeota archaeon]